MNLSDYVSQTLTEIVRGVSQTQELFAGTDVSVGSVRNAGGKVSDSPASGTRVRFDVAVDVTEESTGEGGLKIRVLPFIETGIGGSTGTTSTQSHRVQFDVPLTFSPTPVRSSPITETKPIENKW